MEALKRWVRLEFERSIPIYSQLLGILGILTLSMVPFSLFVSGAIYIPIAVACAAILCIIPAIRHLIQRRGRPSMSPLIGTGVRGKLAETIGPRADQLNSAAVDLEQIKIILNRTKPDGISARDVISAAEGRMRRMVELTVGAPAIYSLTRDEADSQIDADGAWLTETRRLTEKLLPGSPLETLEPAVEDLQEHISAREDAVRELNARG